MSLDSFGLAVAKANVPAVIDWPTLDKYGNVYWVECLEPGCLWRTLPFAKKEHPDLGQAAHAASHGRDTTIKWPNSWERIYVGGPPAQYLRHDHHKPSRSAKRRQDDEDEDDEPTVEQATLG